MTDRQPPIDPNTLPDPDQITEEDLPAAPPRPESVGKRRFGGTHKQIRGALTFYRICAYLTGILLLALVVEMILKYGFDLELFAGGTTFDGADNTLGLHPPESVLGGVNLSLLVLIVHGWMYVVYLVGCFRLWALMRWSGWTLLAMAGGGVVPFLSFYTEHKIAQRTHQELAEHPEGVRRY